MRPHYGEYHNILWQLDINQKFIYEPMTLTIYGISREKKTFSRP